jgi:hypothetical protein
MNPDIFREEYSHTYSYAEVRALAEGYYEESLAEADWWADNADKFKPIDPEPSTFGATNPRQLEI